MVELDLQEQKLLNLRVLQRRDSAVTDILGQCNHVTLYVFEPITKKWDRKDVEGAMFLLQRNEPPFYQLFVLNQLHLGDVSIPLTEECQFRRKDPYIMLRSGDVIDGIWIYDEDQRDMMSDLIQNILQRVHDHLEPDYSDDYSIAGQHREHHHQYETEDDEEDDDEMSEDLQVSDSARGGATATDTNTNILRFFPTLSAPVAEPRTRRTHPPPLTSVPIDMPPAGPSHHHHHHRGTVPFPVASSATPPDSGAGLLRLLRASVATSNSVSTQPQPQPQSQSLSQQQKHTAPSAALLGSTSPLPGAFVATGSSMHLPVVLPPTLPDEDAATPSGASAAHGDEDAPLLVSRSSLRAALAKVLQSDVILDLLLNELAAQQPQ